jgi:hypothetical protein
MTWFLRSVPIAFLVIATVGCSDQAALQKRAATTRAQRLVGVWDVRFEGEANLASRGDDGAREARGQIAFLANRWLDGSDSGIDMPTDYGTYDVDFTPFGIEPRARGETPTAVAGWIGPDSVQIVLTSTVPGMSLELRGRSAGDSVAGTWSYTLSRVSDGGGRFLMARQRQR